MTNSNVFDVYLDTTNIIFETLDDDVNGETTVTIRASDGEQFSDQTLLVKVNPINDAPRLDLTGLEDDHSQTWYATCHQSDGVCSPMSITQQTRRSLRSPPMNKVQQNTIQSMEQ